MFKINVKPEMAKLKKLYGTELPKVLRRAGTAAVRAGVARAATQATKRIVKVVNLKAKEFKKEFLVIQRPKRGQLTGSITISGKPISLRRFLFNPPKGTMFPASQKGVKVSRRQRIKVKVFKGRAVTLKHGFLALGRSSNLQIFRHHKKSQHKTIGGVSTQQPIFKMQVKGIASIFESRGFGTLTLKDAETRVRLTFVRKAKELYTKELNKKFPPRV